jgi:hypothetical protein
MNAPASPITAAAIGAALQGGTCLAHVFIDSLPYAIIVAPKATGEHPAVVWNDNTRRVDGALSYFDGLANTRAMAEAGSKIARWALDQKIEGFEDWFIPARAELLAIHGNVEAAGESFQKGGAEAFERKWYWSSTQHAADVDYAWIQSFDWGYQFYGHKSNEDRVRLVRRYSI